MPRTTRPSLSAQRAEHYQDEAASIGHPRRARRRESEGLAARAAEDGDRLDHHLEPGHRFSTRRPTPAPGPWRRRKERVRSPRPNWRRLAANSNYPTAAWLSARTRIARLESDIASARVRDAGPRHRLDEVLHDDAAPSISLREQTARLAGEAEEHVAELQTRAVLLVEQRTRRKSRSAAAGGGRAR